MKPRDLRLLTDKALETAAIRADARLSVEVKRVRASDAQFDAALALTLAIEDEQQRREDRRI